MSAFSPQSRPYFKWIVASGYYDGVMRGIGERAADSDVVWFKAVAWDEEQWQRVFAVAKIDSSLARELLCELEKIEQPRSPFWLPGSATAISSIQDVWGRIEIAALATDNWRLVEAHDPLSPVIEYLASPVLAIRISELVRSDAFFEFSGEDLLENFLRNLSLQ